ncbi:MAG: C40 family peptidase [Flavobacteriaceae bacterium]
MEWVSRYVGLPYVDGGRAFAGVDCWGLCRLVYCHELGVHLPEYGEISARQLRDVNEAIEKGREARPWRLVDKPQPYDLCVMTGHVPMDGDRKVIRMRVVHVGVMVDEKRVLHIEAATDSVVVPIRHPLVSKRIKGFYRHER